MAEPFGWRYLHVHPTGCTTSNRLYNRLLVVQPVVSCKRGVRNTDHYVITHTVSGRHFLARIGLVHRLCVWLRQESAELSRRRHY